MQGSRSRSRSRTVTREEPGTGTGTDKESKSERDCSHPLIFDQDDEQFTIGNLISLRDMYSSHSAGCRRRDVILHLHAFEDEHQTALFDLIPNGYVGGDDVARHRRHDAT